MNAQPFDQPIASLRGEAGFMFSFGGYICRCLARTIPGRKKATCTPNLFEGE